MKQGYSLRELAEHTGARLQGDAARCFTAVAAVDQAQASDISYIRGGKYRHYLHSSRAGCLILTPELAEEYTGDCLITADPYLAYAKVVTLLNPPVFPAAGIHPSAVVADDADVDPSASIGANAVVESGCRVGADVIIGSGCVLGRHCTVGQGSRLHANVTLGADTQIGARCIIHAGAVLGADGFGFAPDGGAWYKIPQIGNVVLGDDVEVGANTTIDRAAMGSTRIGNGVKLDNQIQVAHNVQIGEHTAIAACAAIAGSTHIGCYCRIGGLAGIGGHLQIADHVTITAMSFVSHSLNAPGVYSSGTTVEENAHWRRNAVRFHHLDTMARRLNALEKQLADLQNNKDSNRD